MQVQPTRPRPARHRPAVRSVVQRESNLAVLRRVVAPMQEVMARLMRTTVTWWTRPSIPTIATSTTMLFVRPKLSTPPATASTALPTPSSRTSRPTERDHQEARRLGGHHCRTHCRHRLLRTERSLPCLRPALGLHHQLHRHGWTRRRPIFRAAAKRLAIAASLHRVRRCSWRAVWPCVPARPLGRRSPHYSARTANETCQLRRPRPAEEQ